MNSHYHLEPSLTVANVGARSLGTFEIHPKGGSDRPLWDLAGIWCGFAKLYIFFRGAAGKCRKHNFWTARVKSITIYIFGILMSRAIDWYIYESNRKGGGSGKGVFGAPLQKITGPLLQNLIISSEFSAQTQSIGTLFEQIGLGGGSVDMSKGQRHTRSGAGRGVSQANEAAIYPKLTGLCQLEIVSEILKKWKYCGTVQASYGCLVGHVFMGVRISVLAP